jgi:uncharacterized protein YhaN
MTDQRDDNSADGEAAPGLHVERLAVHRAPGVGPEAGFALEDLAATVTLIHGPNGAGKTTTAQVLQHLLWPGQTPLGRRAAGAGRLALDGAQWKVEVDGAAAKWWRDGQPAEGPSFGPAELRSRYYLALDQLIQAEDRPFAKQVADATLGDFDLAAAAEALGWRVNPPTRSRERKAVEQRQGELREAQTRQQAVAHEAQRLSALRQRKAEAAAAGAQLEQLKTARQWHTHQQTLGELNAQLEAMPDGLEALTGEELEQARALERQQSELRQQIEQQRARQQEAEQKRAACNLPEAGVEAATLKTLRHQVKTAEGQASELDRLKRERASAIEQQRAARQRLGETINDDQLATMAAIDPAGLSEFAREAERLRAERQVLDERKRWLTSDDAPSGPQSATEDAAAPAADPRVDAATLRQGVTLLANWLATPATATHASMRDRRLMWSMLAAGFAVVLAGALAALVHWAWAGAALVSVALGLIAWWDAHRTGDNKHKPEPGGVDRRTHYQRDYEGLPLAPPERWAADDVAAALETLNQRLAAVTLRDQKAQRLAALEPTETEHERRQAQLDEKRRALHEQLGIAPDVSDEWLVPLIETIGQHHRAADQRGSLDRAIQAAQAQYDQTLKQINDALGPFDLAASRSVAEATAQVETLAERQTAHVEATRQMDEAQHLIDTSLRPQLEDVQRRYARCFTPAGLAVGDQAGLSQMLEHRPRHLELHSEKQRLEALRDHTAQTLEGNTPGQALLECTAAELDARIEQTQHLADEHESLIHQIRDIENHIEHHKQGSDVSDAITAHRQSMDALADRREQDSRAAVGHLLGEYVRQTTAARARPGVFRRGRALLGRITDGRYRLDLSDDAEPQFVAFDETAQQTKALEALSRGARVQLLLAVRLGFVEHEERTAKLPLLLDETLGNADDQRAGAIIDAIVQIARTGRQVFYFSAQGDEIAKWQQRLDEAGIHYAVKDLQHIRGLAAAEAMPLQTVAPQAPAVPAPDGLSHDAFGQRLNVPGLDPRRQSVGAVHLWHLIDEPAALHALLQRGVSQWGQLRNLIEQGGQALLPNSESDWAQLQARARALHAAFEAWRVGRGQLIDRSVLVDSGAVSDKFIDAVSDLAGQCDGDAQALIEALAAGRVSRWQSSKTDQLRDYLEAEGYLDARPAATADDVRLAVLSEAAGDLQQGRVDQPWVERLLARLAVDDSRE